MLLAHQASEVAALRCRTIWPLGWKAKQESSEVLCFHAIFDLHLILGRTSGHVPFSLPPTSISLLFPPLTVILLLAPISLPDFFLHVLNILSHLGERKCSSHLWKTSNLSAAFEKGCETETVPLTPPNSFSFYASGSEVASLTIPQPISPSDRTVLTVSLIMAERINSSLSVKY